MTWGRNERLYMDDEPYQDDLPENRVPTETSALIRFLQRKLGPLPDTTAAAPAPVSVPADNAPLGPLLLTLPAVVGALLGRRLVPAPHAP